MKKTNRRSANDMLPEYDFASMKGGVRGKYAAKYARAPTWCSSILRWPRPFLVMLRSIRRFVQR